jgi:hypothetical protein
MHTFFLVSFLVLLLIATSRNGFSKDQIGYL